MRSTIQEELDAIANWAANNNLRLNTAKSKEMLIPQGGRWQTEAPSPLAMERVGSFRILGVTIASDLSVSAHVEALLNAGACSIYALRLLRENTRVARPGANDRCKGSNYQPHPIYGSCMVGLYANDSNNEGIQQILNRL